MLASGARHAAANSLAPTGVLRAGINLANFLLVSGKTPSGDLVGVAPDLANEFSSRLNVKLQLVPYAGQVRIRVPVLLCPRFVIKMVTIRKESGWSLPAYACIMELTQFSPHYKDQGRCATQPRLVCGILPS